MTGKEPWRELAEIQDALLALDEDDVAARAPLLARRDEIRQQVRAHPMTSDDDRSDDDLRREAAALEREIEHLIAARINLVEQAGSSLAAGPGSDGWGGVELNQAVDKAQGLDHLQTRLRKIRQVLAERGA